MRDGQAPVLSREQFKKLVKGQNKRNTALLYMSFGCGLRVSEIAALNIKDVQEKYGKLKNQLTIAKRNTKTNQSRTIYLDNGKLLSALWIYLNAREKKEGELYSLSAPLFKSRNGYRFSPNSLQQVFKRIYENAGHQDCKSHTGRRSFATWLISDGFDIVNVQELMGHSSIAMTAKYVQANPDKLRKIAAQVI